MGGVRSVTALLALSVLATTSPSPAGNTPAIDPDWVRVLGADRRYEVAEDVIAAPFGKRVYTVGQANEETWDLGIAAYDADDGRRLWLRRHDGPAGGDDLAGAGAITPDGRILIATGLQATAYGRATIVLAYRSTTGALLWRAALPSGSTWSGGPVAVSPEGETVVVADAPSSNGPIIVRAFETATGRIRWNQRIQGSDGVHQVSELAIASGRVFVAGSIPGGKRADGLLRAMRLSDGARIWQHRVDRPDDGVTTHQLAVADGAVGAVQHVRVGGDPSETDASVIALDPASGERLWDRDLAPGSDATPAIATTHRGARFIVQVFSESGLTSSSVAARTGEIRWTASSVGPVDEVAPDGRSFITAGAVSDGNESGPFLIATRYSADTGAELQRFRYDDRFDLRTHLGAVAVTSDRLFLGGSTATRERPDGDVHYYHHDLLLLAARIRA